MCICNIFSEEISPLGLILQHFEIFKASIKKERSRNRIREGSKYIIQTFLEFLIWDEAFENVKNHNFQEFQTIKSTTMIRKIRIMLHIQVNKNQLKLSILYRIFDLKPQPTIENHQFVLDESIRDIFLYNFSKMCTTNSPISANVNIINGKSSSTYFVYRFCIQQKILLNPSITIIKTDKSHVSHFHRSLLT